MKPSAPTDFASPLPTPAAPDGPLLRPRTRIGRAISPGISLRSVTVAVVSVLLVAIGIFFGGFVAFTASIAALERPARPVADGIVVLTGGADRVSGAIDLLTEGRARRLLISGVHPSTSARQIGRLVDAGPSLFDCCVDLDRRAANTLGNAAETAKWTRENGFQSLIVVTSAYHMPRSMAELAHVMPDVRLIPAPVAPPTIDLHRWYESGGTVQLLLSEYLKYIATRMRLAFMDGGAPSAVATAAR